MDSFSKKADPYVKVDLGGVEIKSKVCKNTLSPFFNQVLFLPTISPSLVDSLKLYYKDEDKFTKNDYIGSFHFNM